LFSREQTNKTKHSSDYSRFDDMGDDNEGEEHTGAGNSNDAAEASDTPADMKFSNTDGENPRFNEVA
jgi:hypothetical protein